MFSLYIIGLCLTISVLFNLGFILAGSTAKKRSYAPPAGVITDWKDLASGVSGDIEIERGFLSVMQDQFVLFCQKQHDYGRGNIAVGGSAGLALRLGDKVSRLFSLFGLGAASGEKAPAVKERPEETFIDLANYGTIGVMVERGLWPLKKPEDVWFGKDNQAH